MVLGKGTEKWEQNEKRYNEDNAEKKESNGNVEQGQGFDPNAEKQEETAGVVSGAREELSALQNNIEADDILAKIDTRPLKQVKSLQNNDSPNTHDQNLHPRTNYVKEGVEIQSVASGQRTAALKVEAMTQEPDFPKDFLSTLKMMIG